MLFEDIKWEDKLQEWYPIAAGPGSRSAGPLASTYFDAAQAIKAMYPNRRWQANLNHKLHSGL